jgi:hypothetical protein
MKLVGYARVGEDEDLCQIAEDEAGLLWAKNPMRGGNWVSTGGIYKPYDGAVYDDKQDVPPKRDKPQPVVPVDWDIDSEFPLKR